MATHKVGKKGRKVNRNKDKCEMYRREGRREKNKARRLKKRLRHRLNWLTNRLKSKTITDKQKIELEKLKKGE